MKNLQHPTFKRLLILVFAFTSIQSFPLFASDNTALSLELTTLFRSARAVISKNQSKINDPNLGDKGLSAQYVIGQAKANYKNATGKDLDMSSNSVPKQAMLDAIGDVMSEAQDLINEKGKGLKGFLPAIFARQVATSFNAKTNGKIVIKLTAPKNYVRNRANRPDAWENNIIETKFRSASYAKGTPYSETTTYNGKDGAFRFILPEYYKESCLKCHGEPKGEIDITGGKKEGGKLNELGGAISLVIL